MTRARVWMLVVAVTVFLVCVPATLLSVDDHHHHHHHRRLFDFYEAVEVTAIPRVLFKTGRFSSEATLPAAIREGFTEIRRQNPGHTLVYANDSYIARALDSSPSAFGPSAGKLLATVIPGAYRADVGRLAILWLHGGIYSDLPQTFAVPLDEIVDHSQPDHVLVRDRPTRPWVDTHEGQRAAAARSDNRQTSLRRQSRRLHGASGASGEAVSDVMHGIQTSFLAAPPRSPLVLAVLRGILAQVANQDPGRNPLDLSGPAAVYRHACAFLGHPLGSDPATWSHQVGGTGGGLGVYGGAGFHADGAFTPKLPKKESKGDRHDGPGAAAPGVPAAVHVRVGLAMVAGKTPPSAAAKTFGGGAHGVTSGASAATGARLVFLGPGHGLDPSGLPRHRNGTTAVHCFGAADTTKQEKNALVYAGAAAAKRDHYDAMWKAGHVFRPAV